MYVLFPLILMTWITMFTMAPLAVSHKNSSMGSKDLQKQVNDKVVERYTSGEGYKKMSKALKIPPRTVKTIIKKVESVWHHPQSPKKSVRPSKLDDQERRHLVRETVRNSIATLKENMCITKSQRYCTHLARMGGWHEKKPFLVWSSQRHLEDPATKFCNRNEIKKFRLAENQHFPSPEQYQSSYEAWWWQYNGVGIFII